VKEHHKEIRKMSDLKCIESNSSSSRSRTQFFFGREPPLSHDSLPILLGLLSQSNNNNFNVLNNLVLAALEQHWASCVIERFAVLGQRNFRQQHELLLLSPKKKTKVEDGRHYFLSLQHGLFQGLFCCTSLHVRRTIVRIFVRACNGSTTTTTTLAEDSSSYYNRTYFVGGTSTTRLLQTQYLLQALMRLISHPLLIDTELFCVTAQSSVVEHSDIFLQAMGLISWLVLRSSHLNNNNSNKLSRSPPNVVSATSTTDTVASSMPPPKRKKKKQDKKGSTTHDPSEPKLDEPANVESTTTNLEEEFLRDYITDTENNDMYGVEMFIASGGLRWITSSIITLMLQLGNPLGRHLGHAIDKSSVMSEAQLFLHHDCIHVRILLFLDLLVQLLSLSSRVTTSTLQQQTSKLTSHSSMMDLAIGKMKNETAVAKYLEQTIVRQIWTSTIPSLHLYDLNFGGLTPLSCLIALFHAFSSGSIADGKRHSISGSGDLASASAFSTAPAQTTTTLNLMTGAVSTSRSLVSSTRGNPTNNHKSSSAVLHSYPHYFTYAKSTDRLMRVLHRLLDPLSDPVLACGGKKQASATSSNPNSHMSSPFRPSQMAQRSYGDYIIQAARRRESRGIRDRASNAEAALAAHFAARSGCPDYLLPSSEGADVMLGDSTDEEDAVDDDDDEDGEHLDVDDVDMEHMVDEDEDDDDHDDDMDHDEVFQDEEVGESDEESHLEADEVEHIILDAAHEDEEDKYSYSEEMEDPEEKVLGRPDASDGFDINKDVECQSGHRDAKVDTDTDDEGEEDTCDSDGDTPFRPKENSEQRASQRNSESNLGSSILELLVHPNTDIPANNDAVLMEANSHSCTDAASTAVKHMGEVSCSVTVAAVIQPSVEERKLFFIKEAVSLLEAVNTSPHHQHNSSNGDKVNSHALFSPLKPHSISTVGHASLDNGYKCCNDKKRGKYPDLLSDLAEKALLTSLCNIISPPPKPCNLKIFLRRAPTQEEFFRGGLSKNPILISSIAVSGNVEEGAKVSDLRQHIANDLQMTDSAELLELLVAGKIVAINLPLQQMYNTLWRNHILGTTNGENAATSDTVLQPMVVTYRLAGVDGEATEDIVQELSDSCDGNNCDTKNEDEVKFKATGVFSEVSRHGTGSCGLSILLRCLVSDLHASLRNVRRDAVLVRAGLKRKYTYKTKSESVSRLLVSAPPPALVLLRHAARVGSNRRKLVELRAPSVLLRVLLEVLSALGTEAAASDGTGNPSTDALQDLIELLASDICSIVSTERGKPESLIRSNSRDTDSSDTDSVGTFVGDTTLPLLLSSLLNTTLTLPLQRVVADLLPFLTYGQFEPSKALADQFARNIDFDFLATNSFLSFNYTSKPIILMWTFLQALMSLPPGDVCASLRSQLVEQGFVDRCVDFVLIRAPGTPPPWSPALFRKMQSPDMSTEAVWIGYLRRKNLTVGIKSLIGLSRKHSDAQSYLGQKDRLVLVCHWLETTSFREIDLTDESDSVAIEEGKECYESNTREIGLLAETLLDTLLEGNEKVKGKISTLRKATRTRKKDIAEERRCKALAGLNVAAFGVSLVNNRLSSGTFQQGKANSQSNDESLHDARSNAHLSLPARIGASFAELIATAATFGRAASNTSAREDTGNIRKEPSSLESAVSTAQPTMPAWMAEMDGLQEETGFTCAVCQEGLTLQPKELLGLYAFVKRVTVPSNMGGGRVAIDGSALLAMLPKSLPASLKSKSKAKFRSQECVDIEEIFFRPAKAASKVIQSSCGGSPTGHPFLSSAASSASRGGIGSCRNNSYVTTVTAGNAIHCSCHAKARLADRNHPKAPKSEWEGATLRNSRVNCNAILPLVSLQSSSEVPLFAVDSAISEYTTVISNILGSRPKCVLWTILFDIRWLIMRVAHGEPLNADCGGGSLSSNAHLVFYLMNLAIMFGKTAQHENPSTAQHFKALHLGYIAAWEIIQAKDCDESNKKKLHKGIMDAASMAAICCILNDETDFDLNSDVKAAVVSSSSKSKGEREFNKEGRQMRGLWGKYRVFFLKGLLRSAGWRHIMKIEESGCTSGRRSGGGPNDSLQARRRINSFADWDIMDASEGDDDDDDDSIADNGMVAESGSQKSSFCFSSSGKRRAVVLEDFLTTLKPMCTLFAMVDILSQSYKGNLSYEEISAAADGLVSVVELCQKAKSVPDLLKVSKVSELLSQGEISEEIEKGSSTFG